MDIEKPEAKNGTGGILIHAKVKILPLGPAGPFVLQGFMIADTPTGPDPMGHMEFQADTLALLDHGLVSFRQAFAAAMKQMMEEAQAANLTRGVSADVVRRVKEGKGS